MRRVHPQTQWQRAPGCLGRLSPRGCQDRVPGPSPCTVRRHASEHRDARTALHVLATLCALTVRASLCLLPFRKADCRARSRLYESFHQVARPGDGIDGTAREVRETPRPLAWQPRNGPSLRRRAWPQPWRPPGHGSAASARGPRRTQQLEEDSLRYAGEVGRQIDELQGAFGKIRAPSCVLP